ncbi:hypothetical protein [Streptomyces sp. 058-1L]|uniref:hypothetical protein n=1 Tax=Streptomyces sp. 058-1L TaxID=2789266 RepID=UPI00397FA1D7
MTMKPLTILTGSNRAAEPSSGSLILVNDLYPAMPDTRTIYLGRRPVDQEWRSAFDRLVPISTKKRPLGPGFDAYVDELTQEVGALIEQVRPDAIHAQNVGFALSLAFSRTAGTIPMISIAHGPEVMGAERNTTEHAAMLEVAAQVPRSSPRPPSSPTTSTGSPGTGSPTASPSSRGASAWPMPRHATSRSPGSAPCL